MVDRYKYSDEDREMGVWSLRAGSSVDVHFWDTAPQPGELYWGLDVHFPDHYYCTVSHVGLSFTALEKDRAAQVFSSQIYYTGYLISF